MSLPDFRGEFPPTPWDAAQDQYDLHSAWLEGDTEALEGLYGPYAHTRRPPDRPSTFRGGLVGRVARFFWGRPSKGQDTKRLHVPAPADVARTSADLLFGQPPSWLLSEGDADAMQAAQDRLNQLLDGADVVATLLEAAELQAALGGVYLRMWWDTEATDKVMISAVAPDAAIPQWRYGKLAAVTFWSIVGRDQRGTWRHLEHHEPGRIEHALYCGDDSTIGRRMPLSEMAATAWAADLVDEESAIETGVTGLTACYIPNVRPARRWRNVPGLAPLGRSDFEGVEPLFDALDEAYSSWMRDLHLAKARLFVSADMLESNGPGAGATWDSEQEIFTPLHGADAGSYADGAPSMSDLIHSEQFEIRHEEHLATCTAIMNRILVACGYSVGDFGDDQLAGAMTATEVTARKSLSNQTRAKKILYWQAAMQPFARTMLELDAHVYGGSYGLKADPEMVFPVRVDEDPLALSQTVANLRAAQAMSIETGVRRVNPNWSNGEVDDEVARIKEEIALTVVDPTGGDFESDTEEAHSDLSGDIESDMEVQEAA
ncbi:phage portal protein [Nocardia farcinica]|uniref:phage portal protein n=1 Tax=Nocardia farcinica TaxID=37329 RepID=UPI0024585B4B|nr:phage portal protein [Nocardia farcinica]